MSPKAEICPRFSASASQVNGSVGGPVERDNRLAVNGNPSRFFVYQGGGPDQCSPFLPFFLGNTGPQWGTILSIQTFNGHATIELEFAIPTQPSLAYG